MSAKEMNNFTAINDDDVDDEKNDNITTNSHTIECISRCGCVCATVFTVLRFHLQFFSVFNFCMLVFFSSLGGMCDCIIYHTSICEMVRSECNVPFEMYLED